MTEPSRRPVIGICAVRERARWAFWDQPAHLVADSYVAPVQRAGGVAVLLPVDATPPLELLDWIDGLMLIGGADLDPDSYGAERDPATESTYPERDEFELALLRAAIERALPALCICRGMQVLNVAYGGTLEQHLTEVDGISPHRKVKGTFDGNEHTVTLTAGSLVAGRGRRAGPHRPLPPPPGRARARRRTRRHRPRGLGRRDRGDRARRRALGARRPVASRGRRSEPAVRSTGGSGSRGRAEIRMSETSVPAGAEGRTGADRAGLYDISQRTDVHLLSRGRGGTCRRAVPDRHRVGADLGDAVQHADLGRVRQRHRHAGRVRVRDDRARDLLGRVHGDGVEGHGHGRLLLVHQPGTRAGARDGRGVCVGRRLRGVRGLAGGRVRVLPRAQALGRRHPRGVGLARAVDGRGDLRAHVLRRARVRAPARDRARVRGGDPADHGRRHLRLERRPRRHRGDQPGQRVQGLPGRARAGGRRRRRRHLLRVLVVGRVRDGAELRRGVEEPQADRPAVAVHLGDRARGLLHGHELGVDLGLPLDRRRRGRGAEQRGQLLLHPDRGVRRALGQGGHELPDHHRLVRVRDGVPQHRGAVLLLAGARAAAAGRARPYPSPLEEPVRRDVRAVGDRRR